MFSSFLGVLLPTGSMCFDFYEFYEVSESFLGILGFGGLVCSRFSQVFFVISSPWARVFSVCVELSGGSWFSGLRRARVFSSSRAFNSLIVFLSWLLVFSSGLRLSSCLELSCLFFLS